jgi:hypothetical protein
MEIIMMPVHRSLSLNKNGDVINIMMRENGVPCIALDRKGTVYKAWSIDPNRPFQKEGITRRHDWEESLLGHDEDSALVWLAEGGRFPWEPI